MDLPKNILVVGSGGREHSIIKSLRRSPANATLHCAPGNAGIAQDALIHDIPVTDIPGMVRLAQEQKIDFVVVGPEVPLTLGLVDALKEVGIPAYGPTADGAALEGSKIYTKEILQKYNIPTAPAAAFGNTHDALAYLKTRQVPIVVKADGLAAGKGVIVAQTREEAENAIHALLTMNPQEKIEKKILIEDCLYGEETSILVVVSGRDYLILPTSQDHKRIGENDSGPNTGGMGTYSPAEIVTPELLQQIEKEIVKPSVDAIADEGIHFIGTLFIGIMLTKEGPQVLEYNTRFGDPETQVVLPRIENDLLEILWAATQEKLGKYTLKISPDAAICVVIASKGYPNDYEKGVAIQLPAKLPPSVQIIHAGTAINTSTGQLITAGGRVLGVTAMAPTLEEAAKTAYAVCDSIECTAKYYRRDIGAKQLNRQK